MEPRQLIMLAFAISLFLTVLGFGLRASFADLLYLVRRPGLLTRTVLSMFVIVPVAAVVIDLVFELDHRVEIILITLALSPVPPLLPKKATKVNAGNEYPLALITTMALVSLATVQISILILERFLGRDFGMSPGAMARTILISVVAPLVTGMVVRTLLPRFAARVAKPIAVVAGILLALAAVILVVSTFSAIRALATWQTVLAMVAFVVIGLAAGHVLGGPDPEHAGVLALASAGRHPGIALAIATANFPGEQFGGLILLYLIVGAVICVPYSKWQRAEVAEPVMGPGRGDAIARAKRSRGKP